MSKRKPIYLLRMNLRGVTLTGHVTIEVGAYYDNAGRRAVIGNLTRQLRKIGIEMSPKQVEIHR